MTTPKPKYREHWFHINDSRTAEECKDRSDTWQPFVERSALTEAEAALSEWKERENLWTEMMGRSEARIKELEVDKEYYRWKCEDNYDKAEETQFLLKLQEKPSGLCSFCWLSEQELDQQKEQNAMLVKALEKLACIRTYDVDACDNATAMQIASEALKKIKG